MYLEQEKETLVYKPQEDHRQTFIILHRRRSSAKTLPDTILSSMDTKNKTIQSAFPHAKILFLTPPESQPALFKQAQKRDVTPIDNTSVV